MNPTLKEATPRISVRLFKTIERTTVDGQQAVSARYSGKAEAIDLTPFLNQGSSVVTHKSVRDPAGTFSITFADRPHQSVVLAGAQLPTSALESVYGLIEPMDMIEIRIWNGFGAAPASPDKYPIKMRGFVSAVDRNETMSDSGVPVRNVIVSGHDYGKIWQIIQVIFLAAYNQGVPLLTTFAFSEMFGNEVKNIEKISDLVRSVMENVINKHMRGFIPENSPMPREITLGDSISVKHGVVNSSWQVEQGSIYDILSRYGDVGFWNELYTEDRENGVHCVFRATPALNISGKLIQDDSPDPVFVVIPDSEISSISTNRSDSNVANFYWVSSVRADLTNEIYRKTAAIVESDKTATAYDYPNSALKYYGLRAMYAETQLGEDDMINTTTSQKEVPQNKREKLWEDWLSNRRRLLMEMNRDNVVLERGTARVKGGPMRTDGKEFMKAGDYARFRRGTIEFDAYAVELTDEFLPFQGYTTTISFERGTGFVKRIQQGGGVNSPWLAEQATRLV